MRCRHCNSLETVKNGSNGMGKQKYKGKDCCRQFVLNPNPNRISEETKQLIEELWLEKISLAGIASVTNVSKKWRWSSTPLLQDYVNKKYREAPQQIEVKKKPNKTNHRSR